nr:unnamed protein product [Callosobruchus chinensis]
MLQDVSIMNDIPNAQCLL